MKTATLFFDESEDSQRALEEVRKLEKAGFQVEYWNTRDLGETHFQPPLCFINRSRCISNDPRWIFRDSFKWIPLDGLKNITKVVQSELRLAQVQSD